MVSWLIKLNGTELIFKSFPNGETLVDGDKISDLLVSDSNLIVFKYENDSDLIKLLLVKSHIDATINTETSLRIFYMPYSRMDRVEGESVFTLKYISKLINSLDFYNVEISEPHSDVTLALVDNSFPSYPTIKLLSSVMDEVNFDKESDYLFFPDSGAAKRYSKVKGFKTLIGHKERDFQTGDIKRLDILGSVEGSGFKVIILDDLSSYGGTFLKSAEKLSEIGASEIYLLVGHAEESIYKGKVFEEGSLIDKVFTTDSIISEEKNIKIKIYPLGGL
jgi:ribose-phosphate pyrophosphokinase